MQGDACRVDELAAGPHDAVLLMGPLCHLAEEEQRAQAMRAALACLRPGGQPGILPLLCEN
jgi:hypothetical protein